jgi:hypothetical protein
MSCFGVDCDLYFFFASKLDMGDQSLFVPWVLSYLHRFEGSEYEHFTYLKRKVHMYINYFTLCTCQRTGELPFY